MNPRNLALAAILLPAAAGLALWGTLRDASRWLHPGGG